MALTGLQRLPALASNHVTILPLTDTQIPMPKSLKAERGAQILHSVTQQTPDLEHRFSNACALGAVNKETNSWHKLRNSESPLALP